MGVPALAAAASARQAARATGLASQAASGLVKKASSPPPAVPGGIELGEVENVEVHHPVGVAAVLEEEVGQGQQREAVPVVVVEADVRGVPLGLPGGAEQTPAAERQVDATQGR
jgi:hypothetical protein